METGGFSGVPNGALEDRFTAGMSALFSFTTLLLDKGKTPAQQHAQYLSRLPAHTFVIYTNGSKLDDRRCASARLFTTPALNTTKDSLTGSCYLGKKCKVYDAELHAISQALPLLLSTPPSTVLLGVDNRSALTALQEGNPDNHEYARTALNHLSTLQQSGWTITGLWTVSHCGIPGNERVDQLAKNATQFHTACPQARVTKCWLQAQARKQLLADWNQYSPPEPSFRLRPSLSTPKHLAVWGSHTTSAYLKLQAGTTPSDSASRTDTLQCPCGAPLSSRHLFFECPLLEQARAELPSSNKDIHFDTNMVSHVVSFLRTTGYGFNRYPNHQVIDPEPTNESVDDEVGPVIGDMLLDLAI
jgi:ribonuclease HI